MYMYWLWGFWYVVTFKPTVGPAESLLSKPEAKTQQHHRQSSISLS
jgi:hypothetical protein